MEKITFIGEHLWIGNLGNLLVIVATITALFSATLYYLDVRKEQPIYKATARKLLLVHNIAVLGIFVTLFAIIFNHYYEYQYAWQHSSDSLPVYYMISCFWEGQEGSFLLWMIWHVVIAWILRYKAGVWESSVLSVITLAQFVLGTMILGIEIAGVKIGSSPFVLLRDFQPEMLDIPVLKQMGKENYLNVIKDGSGLNPLLQNYWMVIHPPTLFFGFATAIVPFAYALGGLLRNQKEDWLLPALIWTLISSMVLGAGIIMGGYWAYESLNFGGYWAWDPVENASLMPWILLISAAHILLISHFRKKFFVLSRVLLFFSFFLVLYATFLTRSGILGEASVHSFTDLGLSGQLLFFIFLFIFITAFFTFTDKKRQLYFALSFALVLLINIVSPELVKDPSLGIGLRVFDLVYFLVVTYFMVENLLKINPTPESNDSFTAREFWMFLGSLVLLLSAVHVTFGTSSPVLNKLFLKELFGLTLSVPGPEEFNKVQIFFAMGIALLSGLGQLFKYKATPSKTVQNNILYTLIGTVVLWVLMVIAFNIKGAVYVIFLFFVAYTLVANTYYLIKTTKKLSSMGASIAHLGFGILLVGVLVSSVNKTYLSQTTISENLRENTSEENRKLYNQNMLFKKNLPAQMGPYWVTFRDTLFEEPNKFFLIDYQRINKQGDTIEAFTLRPNTQFNPNMGLVSNPDTRHYWDKDIFTHITHESGMDQSKSESFKNFKNDTVAIGQNFLTHSGTKLLHLDSITSHKQEGEDIYLTTAFVTAVILNDTFQLSPSFTLDVNAVNQMSYHDDASNEAGVIIRLASIDTKNNKFIFTIGERKPQMDYIVMTAIAFPFIRLVWIGTILMVLGFFVALRNRIRQVRKSKA